MTEQIWTPLKELIEELAYQRFGKLSDAGLLKVCDGMEINVHEHWGEQDRREKTLRALAKKFIEDKSQS